MMEEAWNVNLRRRLHEGQEVLIKSGSTRLYSLAFSAAELGLIIDAIDAYEKPVATACQDSAALSAVVVDVNRRLKAIEDWRRRWVGFVDEPK